MIWADEDNTTTGELHSNFKLSSNGEALFLSNAPGNILDSIFYGKIFTESFNDIAKLFPEGGGYSGLLHGKVVDMLYFPIIEGHFPTWFPMWGSEEFIFFRPVFNLADFSISVGVFLILINQKRFFLDSNFTLATQETEAPASNNSSPEAI